MNIRDDLLTQQLLTFTKRPYVGWKLLMQQEKEVKIELKYTLMIHDDNLESHRTCRSRVTREMFTNRTAKDYSRSQRSTGNHGR